MKVCFIGNCGNHSITALSALKKHKETELCGFAPSTDFDGCPVLDTGSYFDDWQKMLDTVKPELVVSSPVYSLTASVATECAKRHINVISEKPVATSLDDLDSLERALNESKIRFTAMHFLRFAPAFYTAGMLARSGKIGDIKLITAQKSYKYGDRPQWYGERKYYGGTIPWIGIHAIDWISFFAGGKKFISVDARHSGDPEKSALCFFEMEDGIEASVNIDYYRPAGAISHGDDRIRCVGTKGIIEVANNKISLITESEEKEITPLQAPNLTEEFIKGNDPIAVDEILALTRAALTARESADSKKELKI